MSNNSISSLPELQGKNTNSLAIQAYRICSHPPPPISIHPPLTFLSMWQATMRYSQLYVDVPLATKGDLGTWAWRM